MIIKFKPDSPEFCKCGNKYSIKDYEESKNGKVRCSKCDVASKTPFCIMLHKKLNNMIYKLFETGSFTLEEMSNKSRN